MNSYQIEIGEEANPFVCHCLNGQSFTGHGFVYKNGDAYAIYYVGWSIENVDKQMTLALALGEWDDDSTVADRDCFGIEATEAGDQVNFRVIEPDESPWPKTDLMGEMMERDKSLHHPLLDEAFTITEYVLRNHNAVREHLNLQPQ